jgi:NAD(P)-dependent dehydrogenase (short-subunit alcohol dehydrogenase family)
MSEKWTERDVPDQKGRVAVVTGANTGLGFETARVLAERGASVVLAVRDVENGKRAAARIAETAPGADLTVQELDLTSLESVRIAVAELRPAPEDRSTDQQRRRDDSAEANHPRRVRAAVRHQPPRALRAHRTAA